MTKVDLFKTFQKNHPRQYKNGIFDFIGTGRDQSISGYENLHKQPSGRIDDGSYEIIATFARGNKSVDIGCGEGFLEELSPETVGVDFSLNALKKAARHRIRLLVRADAHRLPFLNKSFDISICLGSLEHFRNPFGALKEMERISNIQILTVHREFPIPFGNFIRNTLLALRGIENQPIDNPLSWHELQKLLDKAKLKVVFKGLWTYPFNLEFLGIKPLERLNIPSCYFVITTCKK